jgi:hypothetical protein
VNARAECLGGAFPPGPLGIALPVTTADAGIPRLGLIIEAPKSYETGSLQLAHHRPDVLGTYIQDEDEAHSLAMALAKTQGFNRATTDLATRNSRKWVGAKFLLERLTDESRLGLVVIEDQIGSRAAADAIRSNGDIIQFKSYRNCSHLRASIERQVESDLRRYAANRWRSGVGDVALSGVFEYQVDGDRLQRGGWTRPQIERVVAEMEANLNSRFSAEMSGGIDTNRRAKYKVVVVFGDTH